MKQPRIVIVPGRGNSPAGHWQSLIEQRFPNSVRVERDDWHAPALDVWSKGVDDVLRDGDEPALVVAHSFGCLAVVQAQRVFNTPIGAALFVAPASPERFGLASADLRVALPNPLVLVASDNDPWMPLDQALSFGAAWGARTLTLHNAGHINIDSGHGSWPLGETLVRNLLAGLCDTQARRQAPAPRRTMNGIAASA